jgi:hypothetical protein
MILPNFAGRKKHTHTHVHFIFYLFFETKQPSTFASTTINQHTSTLSADEK